MWLQFEPPPDDEPVLAVSELTAQIKAALQDEFPKVRVSGEISDLARPRSGHVYLTMKDEAAQIRAVIWRNAAQKLNQFQSRLLPVASLLELRQTSVGARDSWCKLRSR